MAFFDVPTDDQIPPESARLLEEYRELTGTAEAPRSHRTYGRLTRIVETRLRAAVNLHDQCSFPKQTKYVAAMLIAFIALVALVNGGLEFLHRGLNSVAGQLPGSSFLAAYFPENLQQILGVIFRPIAWAMGVSWKDSFQVGNLLGTRLVLNELFAFLQLGQISSSLDSRSFIITTFALCGFANFGSIAIQVGGIGALAPSRRHDLAALGIRAMIAGTIANFLSATIAGMIL